MTLPKAIDDLQKLIADWKHYKEPCSCCNHTDDEYCMPGWKGEELLQMIKHITEILNDVTTRADRRS